MNGLVQSFWMSSGSCPLCLTPPCYHFPAASGRLFFIAPDPETSGYPSFAASPRLRSNPSAHPRRGVPRPDDRTPRLRHGVLGRPEGGADHFLPKLKAPKRELKRDTRPPRSSSCCWPPVQAGCVLGSMSRLRTLPSLP